MSLVYIRGSDVGAEGTAVDDSIAALDAQIAKLRQRKLSLVAKRTHARRRRDAHCKILVGAALLALVDGGDGAAAVVYQSAVARARRRSDRDAADLDAWVAERDEARTQRREEPTGGVLGEGTRGGEA